MSKKIRLIFLPFLLITVSFILLYTFLNWLLIIKLEAFSIKEIILQIWLPFIFPWIPILIWLRPRIKLLDLKRKKGDLPGLYMFIASMAISIPTIIAQKYIVTAAGKLTKLETISELNKHEKSKYYSLDKYFIDKQNIGIFNTVDVSGKHNDNYNMHIYIALPIFDNISDTANTTCSNWMGYEYRKQISNKLSEDEKETSFQGFAERSLKDFEERDFGKFIYLDRIGNTDEREGFKTAISKNEKFEGSNNNMILMAVDEPFSSRNGNKLAWIFGAFGIGAAVWLIMLLIPKFQAEELTKFQSGHVINDNEIRKALEFFVPNKVFFITPIIFNLNILIFIIMVFAGLGLISFKAIDLLHWGGNFRPYTTNGQWWRLLTSTFLHGGLMHLLANMYGLIFVGFFLEPVLGKNKYLASYLVTGVLASLASLWWHEATVSVGASGAIFGLYGIFLALLLAKVFPKEMGRPFLISTSIFIGYNLLMGLTGGIDNAAHIGGLVSGFIIGILLAPSIKKKEIKLTEEGELSSSNPEL